MASAFLKNLEILKCALSKIPKGPIFCFKTELSHLTVEASLQDLGGGNGKIPPLLVLVFWIEPQGSPWQGPLMPAGGTLP